MTVWTALGTVLSIAWTLYQAITSKDAAKAAATAALTAQFATLEAQGQPILQGIVQNMGKTTFEAWVNVPIAPAPGAIS